MSIDRTIDTAILDAALMPPSLRATIIAGWRELAAASNALGQLAERDAYLERADALEWGGRITLGEQP